MACLTSTRFSRAVSRTRSASSRPFVHDDGLPLPGRDDGGHAVATPDHHDGVVWAGELPEGVDGALLLVLRDDVRIEESAGVERDTVVHLHLPGKMVSDGVVVQLMGEAP